jgi:hypothetical protein
LRFLDPNGEDCITVTNETSGSITVSTERGGSAGSCNGTFVNGTVDMNSFVMNGDNLTWSDTTKQGGGAMMVVSGVYPTAPDAMPPGVAEMLHGVGEISDARVKDFMTLVAGTAIGEGAGALIGAGLEAYGPRLSRQIVKFWADESGEIIIDGRLLNGAKSIRSYISATLQRSKSWAGELADMALADVEALAASGSPKAQKMLKLVKDSARLMEKVKQRH